MIRPYFGIATRHTAMQRTDADFSLMLLEFPQTMILLFL